MNTAFARPVPHEIPARMVGHPDNPYPIADLAGYAKRLYVVRRKLTVGERMRHTLARWIDAVANVVRPQGALYIPADVVAGAIEALIAEERAPSPDVEKREVGLVLLETRAAPPTQDSPELIAALGLAEMGIEVPAPVMARVVRYLLDHPDFVAAQR